MKTNGFREIDFSKTECPNYNCGNEMMFFPPRPLKKGEIINLTYTKGSGFFDSGYYSLSIIDCPVCKGTGFIDESVTTELELENE